MKLEKFQEKKKRKIGMILLGTMSLIAIGYLVSRTYAAYQENKDFRMMEGTFDYFQGSDVYFAFYQNDIQVSTMPSKESGYVFNPVKSNCTNEAVLEWNQDKWSPTITNLTRTKTKCTLYFDTGKNLGEEIFKNETGKTNVSEAKQVIEAKGTPDFSQAATTNEGMFAAEDDYGTSYYYRGAVENNYVKFAGYYWRIIRVNGDGSIKLIYNGDKPDQTGSHTQIGESSFNTLGDNPAYVGYMYGTTLNTSYNQTHANEMESNMKKMLDRWYIDYIYTKGYTSSIADEIFCNDRSVDRGDGYTTSGQSYFGAYKRLASNRTPSLICPQENDKFTTTEAPVGNKALTYPIGLITADEAFMAGALNGIFNTKFYLYTSKWYWTMSSSSFSRPDVNSDTFSALGWRVGGDGSFGGCQMKNTQAVRVVLNLKVDTKIVQGNGTSENPYFVS